ncbi:menaquinone biosynthetic enzyme MqnA/MqnD family protein [Algisphaera agarilytica]|uniref:Chorismate dehydratase n=1 Tax=Algisphaera agarilytica TaxID=1385975 RepID=A0A7X0H7T5_9BACT|nr:menaquinone biosynthesis protein [Algisphaera agarilytica]MBB6430841.1 chorismate dehydratase [Algisphaera agarilytica]
MVDAESTPNSKRIGCVSYLNAKPLIHGLPAEAGELQLEVPSRLIGRLLSGEVDLALCSVVDHFFHPEATRLVPVGGIACEGPTLTVRLFSRVPMEKLTKIHADTDSHTSVLLLRVLLHDLYGLTPELVHYDTRAQLAGQTPVDPAHPPEAMLLIGDKVVTNAPPATVYPYQLDLGAAWHDLTDRPFVFATWLAKADGELGELPTVLSETLKANLGRLDEIVQTYAATHGWPADMAAEYLGNILRFEVGERELDAIAHFRGRLESLGLIESLDVSDTKRVSSES